MYPLPRNDADNSRGALPQETPAPRDDHEQANSILHSLLEYLPSGVTLFGPDLEMIACNAKLRELLDFPEELFAHGLPSLPALLRFNAMRGDYGPGDPEKIVADGIERARKMEPHVFERTRPNGVVLEVRGTPLPGGGFVTLPSTPTSPKGSTRRSASGTWRITTASPVFPTGRFSTTG